MLLVTLILMQKRPMTLMSAAPWKIVRITVTLHLII